MGKLFKIILVFVVIVGVLIIGRNTIIRAAIEKGAQVAVGLPLEIKKLDVGLMSSHVGITDLKLFNPSGFPEGVMFYAPEIFVDYHLGDILKKNIHLEECAVKFWINLFIVKNAKGQTNLEALKPKAKDGSGESSGGKASNASEKRRAANSD